MNPLWLSASPVSGWCGGLDVRRITIGFPARRKS